MSTSKKTLFWVTYNSPFWLEVIQKIQAKFWNVQTFLSVLFTVSRRGLVLSKHLFLNAFFTPVTRVKFSQQESHGCASPHRGVVLTRNFDLACETEKTTNPFSCRRRSLGCSALQCINCVQMPREHVYTPRVLVKTGGAELNITRCILSCVVSALGFFLLFFFGHLIRRGQWFHMFWVRWRLVSLFWQSLCTERSRVFDRVCKGSLRASALRTLLTGWRVVREWLRGRYVTPVADKCRKDLRSVEIRRARRERNRRCSWGKAGDLA